MTSIDLGSVRNARPGLIFSQTLLTLAWLRL